MSVLCEICVSDTTFLLLECSGIMSKIDQFESVFKSATKEVFHFSPTFIEKICVVTDLEGYKHKQFVLQIREFLEAVGDPEDLEWIDFDQETSQDLGSVLEQIESIQPDLICTYRNLHSTGWQWPYSLGEHLHVFTQATTIPILVLPRPDLDFPASLLQSTETVMAITDHLAGDEALVNVAANFTAPDGTLYLTHVEDQNTFEHYIELISKIPDLNTDVARETIHQQILKEPTDYIESCRQGLEDARIPLSIQSIVAVGEPLTTYKFFLAEHQVNLLVLHTKDDNQSAMQNLAYTLAVELRDIPLLML